MPVKEAWRGPEDYLDSVWLNQSLQADIQHLQV